MTREIPFDPCPLFDDPHRQTIANAFCNDLFDATSKQKLICLPDGDQLSLEITTPPNWKATDLTVFLVHGLCGSHRSPNLVRMAKRLELMGIRSVRYNMRGCGSGKGLSRKIYHSGQSHDVFEALKALQKEHPESPTILIGFSLGGNITLKLVGELGSLGGRFLKGAIAVSPPTDLASSVRMVGQPDNEFYESYFYRTLRDEVYYRYELFKDLPRIELPKGLKLYQFDQLYTAPTCGFRNADDYYNKCSSAPLVPDIGIPTRILLSEDDPIIASTSLDALKLPSHVQVFKTKKGGHMGYLGHPKGEKGFYWLDSLLVDWIQQF